MPHAAWLPRPDSLRRTRAGNTPEGKPVGDSSGLTRLCTPDATIDTLNVWEENLPDFDQQAIGAKYNGVNKQPIDQAETAVWNKIQELALRFQQADRIVLSVPLWNFAYPYQLKQLIDLVCRRQMLFTRNYRPSASR